MDGVKFVYQEECLNLFIKIYIYMKKLLALFLFVFVLSSCFSSNNQESELQSLSDNDSENQNIQTDPDLLSDWNEVDLDIVIEDEQDQIYSLVIEQISDIWNIDDAARVMRSGELSFLTVWGLKIAETVMQDNRNEIINDLSNLYGFIFEYESTRQEMTWFEDRQQFEDFIVNEAFTWKALGIDLDIAEIVANNTLYCDDSSIFSLQSDIIACQSAMAFYQSQSLEDCDWIDQSLENWFNLCVSIHQ